MALDEQQVIEYNLPVAMGKATDPRAATFRKQHGTLVQVELDALDRDTLRDMYRNDIDDLWDDAAYREVLAEEDEHRARLQGVANNLTTDL